MTVRSQQLLAIDLVRFACASMVVALHYTAVFPLSASARAAGITSALARWGWPGWIGVEIFFVISGYVIACSAATGDGLGFLKRRALRLAPAAWICASITAIAVIVSGSAAMLDVFPGWIASMTFWPIATQIDGSYWTLGIELAFYILVSTQLGGSDNVRAIERIGLGLATVSLFYWSWAIAIAPVTNRAVDLLMLTYGGFFAIGIALWSIRARGLSALRIATALIGLAAAIAEIVMTAATMRMGDLDPGPAAPLALFGIAITVIAAADRLQPALDRLIGAKPLALAGLATYPLYLVHQRVGEIIIVLLRRLGIPSHVTMLLAALDSLAIAIIVVLALEPPLRRWLARRMAGLGKDPDTTARSSAPGFPAIEG